MNNEENSLATELLHIVKASAKRWFVMFIVTLCLWFATIIGFVCYEYFSLPTEEVSVENEDGNANYIGNDMNGDINNGEGDSETSR